jgi:hypothetical protein
MAPSLQRGAYASRESLVNDELPSPPRAERSRTCGAGSRRCSHSGLAGLLPRWMMEKVSSPVRGDAMMRIAGSARCSLMFAGSIAEAQSLPGQAGRHPRGAPVRQGLGLASRLIGVAIARDLLLLRWCWRRDSNPHCADFKSAASADWATPACAALRAGRRTWPGGGRRCSPRLRPPRVRAATRRTA